MKKLFSLLILFTCIAAAGQHDPFARYYDYAIVRTYANTFYVAPSGNNNNPGTINSPFATLGKLSSVLKPGDIAYVRGGIYRGFQTISGLNGNAGDTIRILAMPGEKPVLDFSDRSAGSQWGLTLSNCHYVHIKGIRITNLNGGVPAGFVVENSTHNLIDRIEVDHCSGYGYKLEGGAKFNTLLNCDAHHLQDSGNENANGFNQTGCVSASDNVFDGCRAWWISDDGFDLYATNGKTTFKNCWSFWNGYNPGTFNDASGGDGQGFKLGPTGDYQNEGCPDNSTTTSIRRVLINNIAFENKSNGFDQNYSRTITQATNNTVYKNGGTGFRWGYNVGATITQQFTKNLSYKNGESHQGVTGTGNSWNGGVTVSTADFLSESSAGADGQRGSNGELPVLNFLKLSPGSDLVGIGADRTGSGTTPPPPPGNIPPGVNAGPDQTISLPVNSVSLSAAASDLDGFIASILWTKLSGPSTYLITSTTTAATQVNNLVAGSYIFQVTVTDNKGATATDQVTITINQVGPPPSANIIINLAKEVIGEISVSPSGLITVNMRSDIAKPMYFILYQVSNRNNIRRVYNIPAGNSTQNIQNIYTGKVIFSIVDK